MDRDSSEQVLAADWPETWRFYERHRDEFLRALGALGVRRDEAIELANEFVLARLPRVAARTRTLADDEAAKYLRAAVRNFARTAFRRRTREHEALKQFAGALEPDPTSGLSESEFESLPPFSIDELGLQDLHRRALQMYFGLDDREHSLREIARALRISRHAASHAVIDGLAAAALALRHHGALDPREHAACRAVLLDGASIARAADDFSLPTERVRRSLRMLRAAGTDVVHGT